MPTGETEPGGRNWWDDWQGPILTAAAAAMAMVAALWLGYQFWRLLWQPADLAGIPVHPGAVDLVSRYDEIRIWFSGGRLPYPVYPPASYLMLWPLLGWLPLQWTIKLWAVTSLAALGWLAALAVRESRVDDRMARRLAALLPLSMYAAGAAIGNGQLAVFVLPALMSGLLALRRGPASWSRDIWVSLLFVASLVKPSISAPFFWILAFTTGRLRPPLLVVLGYVLLAVAASPFNPGGPVWQHYDWLSRGTEATAFVEAFAYAPPGVVRWPTQVSRNVLAYLLTQIGLERWMPAASLAVLLVLGLWVYRNRRADVWLLLGVSGIAAKLWMYHQWYDDLVILLPMLALVRMARSHTGPGTAPAVWLLAGTLLTSLAPGGLYLLPQPLNGVYVIVQLAVWVAVLVYLLSCTGRHMHGGETDPSRGSIRADVP